jgi:hypothetical protein
MPVPLRIFVALLSLAACGDDSSTPPADAGPPTIELGTGEREFETIIEGDNVFIVQGPQDGYHLFGSLRATNVNAGNIKDLTDPENPTTIFEVYNGTEQVDLMASTYRQGLRSSPFGVEMIGRNVILDIEDDSELDGVMLRFVVRLEDVDGVVVTDERMVIGRAHPNNQ